MTFPFSDRPACEASALNGFSGNRVDRQSEHRAEDCVERALDEENARVMVTSAGRLLFETGKSEAPEAWHKLEEARFLGARFDRTVLLGRQDGRALLAAPSGLGPEELPPSIKAIDYRSVYVQGLLDPAGEGAFAQGAAMLAWHANHRFCGRCGHASDLRQGGVKRVCPNCQAEHFPRTDPVAIMLAIDTANDRCLLGRSPHFPPGMFSCLAGFIEPGETIENAVRRETQEESGIRIGRVAYHASQPWPFPYSLMIGCYGEARSFDIDRDKTELEDCRWFTRDEVREMRQRPLGDPDLPACPPSRAIAGRLIGDWVEAS